MIVIPMAGESSRFQKAGFKSPKFMLEINGKTVFDRAIMSFEHYFDSEAFIFIIRDKDNTPEFVNCRIAALGISEARLKILEQPTSGQAETVALGLRNLSIPEEEPITIFNIDTFRPGFRYPDSINLTEVDGYLEVFNGAGDNWSFVKPDMNSIRINAVAEVAEKVPISNLCSTGLYYFRRCDLFLEAYTEIEGVPLNKLQGKERYIAPMYNELLRRGKDIRFNKICSDKVFFSGTPLEYLHLKNTIELI